MKFNVEIDDSHTKVESDCTLPELCGCISKVICACYKDLGDDTGEKFKYLFARGFHDGVCFGTNREEMDKVFSEADKKIANTSEFVDKLLKNHDDKLSHALLGVLKELLLDDDDEKED